jgi:hypothetical protein
MAQSYQTADVQDKADFAFPLVPDTIPSNNYPLSTGCVTASTVATLQSYSPLLMYVS